MNTKGVHRGRFASSCRTLFGNGAAALAVSLLFDFTPGSYAAFIGVFTTPLAVSSVPMAQEMGSDNELCGQLVIFTTLASGLGIFLFTWAMKALGVF